MSYHYLWFVKWYRPHAVEQHVKDPKYSEKWYKKQDEIYKKHGIELLFKGGSIGTQEHFVTAVKTEMDLIEFNKVNSEIYAIDPKIIDWSRTITVTPI